MGQRIVIIGGVAAGMTAAGSIRRRRGDWAITVFEAGPHISYAACGTPYFIGGAIPDSRRLIVLDPEEARRTRGVDVRLGHEATSIDPANRRVAIRHGGRTVHEPYDQLLLATGARPIRPPFLDPTVEGVFELRNLQQAERMKEFLSASAPRRAVILGAGYVGLEMAEALRGLGLETTLLEKAPELLPGWEASIRAVVAQELERHGIRVVTGVGAVDLHAPSGRARSILGEDGREYPADAVLCAVGIRPNNELAAAAGARLGFKGAVEVDRLMRTHIDGIWAAGDVGVTWHRLLERNHWIPLGLTANRQGRVAGANIAGEAEPFPGTLGTSLFKVFDLAVARTGLSLAEARGAGWDAVCAVSQERSRAGYYPGGAPVYMAVVVEKRTGRLLGAQMAGRDGVGQRIDIFAAALWNGMNASSMEEMDLAYAPPFAPVWDPVLIGARMAAKEAAGA